MACEKPVPLYAQLKEHVLQNIRSGAYPFMRPLVLVTGERPTGVIRKAVEFMQSPEGQELVRKSELTPVDSH